MAEHEPCIGHSDEWFTPPEIFEALGVHFDLDPCWSPSQFCRVPTRKAYSAGGLDHPWVGTVWLNPPFGGRHGHLRWLIKFLDHGDGIALVRAYTSSDWFHEHVAPRAQTLLFPKGKTKFIRGERMLAADGVTWHEAGTRGGSPGHGVVLVGMGPVANAALNRCGLGFFVDNTRNARGR